MKLSELTIEKLLEDEKNGVYGGQQPGSYNFGYSLGSSVRKAFDILSLSLTYVGGWR